MADKVHPSAKPPPPPPGAGPAPRANPAFPATKAQPLSNNAGRRPPYRPPQPRRSASCCRLCLWTTATLIGILFLAAVAGAVFYFIYQPRRPSFSLDSLHLSYFNLTDASAMASSFNISLIATNSNRKITLMYDQTTVRLFSGNVDVGQGSFSGFAQNKSVTRLSAVVARAQTDQLDAKDLACLKSSLRRKSLALRMEMETKIRAGIGTARTPRFGIRVTCNGIKIPISSGKTASSATTSNVKCKLDLRFFNIFHWET